ncbi:Uncharacterised protein [Flavobacterium hibernum]|nr:Uncharacterised protein [Flavobacterium hibernum]
MIWSFFYTFFVILSEVVGAPIRTWASNSLSLTYVNL